jgi:hypothetical protein
MKRVVFICTCVALAALFFSSCGVEPGEGGLASIRGKVFGYDINSSGKILDSSYVGDARVFISYGNHSWSDDDVRTAYNGEYAFRGLQKGKYTLWVFSQCDSCPFNQTYVKKEAEITESEQEVILSDFVIYD